MERRIDFELLNFDRELGSLREAVTNLQDASAKCGPPLRAYIKALKTLNTEMLGRLKPLLRRLGRAETARPNLGGLRGRQSCRGVVARERAAINGRDQRRIGANSASRLL